MYFVIYVKAKYIILSNHFSMLFYTLYSNSFVVFFLFSY